MSNRLCNEEIDRFFSVTEMAVRGFLVFLQDRVVEQRGPGVPPLGDWMCSSDTAVKAVCFKLSDVQRLPPSGCLRSSFATRNQAAAKRRSIRGNFRPRSGQTPMFFKRWLWTSPPSGDRWIRRGQQKSVAHTLPTLDHSSSRRRNVRFPTVDRNFPENLVRLG